VASRRRMRERQAQPRDQRILRPLDVGELRVSRERLEGIRIKLEHARIGAARLLPAAEILVQVGEILQRREIAGIEREGGAQLALGGLVLAQAVGEDDAAVEVNFFGSGNALLERAGVRGERRFELTRLALQQPEVVPAVRQVGPAREQALTDGNRLGELAEALETRGLAEPVRGCP